VEQNPEAVVRKRLNSTDPLDAHGQVVRCLDGRAQDAGAPRADLGLPLCDGVAGLVVDEEEVVVVVVVEMLCIQLTVLTPRRDVSVPR
jgi:hypothetical protein